MKIYTKKGDAGETLLLNGAQSLIAKSDTRVEAFGTIDELNSWIGLVADEWTQPQTKLLLLHVQRDLFTLGSHLAVDYERTITFSLPIFPEDAVYKLEQAIDVLSERLSPLRSFILPGGHPEISHIHIARTTCRRAERACVRVFLPEEKKKLFLPYINRLSDYLFVLARTKATMLDIEEIQWIPKQ